MRNLILIIILILIGSESFATIYYEKDYQKVWCDAHNGKTEVKLADETRIDCLTNDYAIEFDFAKKWGESIGQALYYALSTGKKPGIVLILENSYKDGRYLARVNKVAQSHNITVWTMTPHDMRNSGVKPH